jgi:hypothetical protein
MTLSARSIPVPRLRQTGLAAALAALALPAWSESSPAPAASPGTEEASPYTLGVLETITHDSNVFRIQDGLAVTPPAARADWFSTTGIIGSIDQQISRERLKANAEFDINRFRDNTQLNSNAHSFSIEGDWETVDRLSGELGYTNSEQLYRYNLNVNQAETALNQQQTNSGFARFHLGSGTRLSFDAIFTALNVAYTAPDYKLRDIKRWDGTLGTTYASSQDLRWSFQYRYAQGQYPNYATELDPVTGEVTTVPDNFSRNGLSFGVDMAATGASTFHGRISWAKEDHSQITTRSYSFWGADGKWVWIPTGRTQVTLDFLVDDDTGSSESALFVTTADARKRAAASAGVNYELTGKTKLHATASYAHRNLDSSFSGGGNSTGTDQLWNLGLGLDYLPTRSIQLGCTASRERRSTSGNAINITYPYSATVFACTGQLAFN